MSDEKSITFPVHYREIKPGYRVGDDGSVWSCIERVGNGRFAHAITDEWHELKGVAFNPSGYLKVALGATDQRQVHRLVLEAFVGPCPPGMQCRHLDGNPKNNRLENLCWGTSKENHEDAARHGRFAYGERHRGAKLDGSKVIEILGQIARGDSQHAIARRFGVTQSVISRINSGRRWKHIERQNKILL